MKDSFILSFYNNSVLLLSSVKENILKLGNNFSKSAISKGLVFQEKGEKNSRSSYKITF